MINRFRNYIANAKMIEGSGFVAVKCIRLVSDLAKEQSPEIDSGIIAALELVRGFISDEVECREGSMLPTSGQDANYIAEAMAALRAVDQLGIYLSPQTGMRVGR